MPINTSMYNALIQPRSVADYAADYDEQDLRDQRLQVNALALQSGRQKLDEYGRTVRDKETALNALAALGGNATPQQRIGALYGSGTGYGLTQAQEMEKQMAEQQKARAEAASKNAGLLKQYSTILTQSPTQATAMALLNHYETTTGERADEIRGILQQAGDSPDVLRQIAFALSTAGDNLLPKTQSVDAGNARVQQVVNPVTGVAAETGRVPIMQSPDSRATAGTAAARLRFDRDKFNAEQTGGSPALLDAGGVSQAPLVKMYGKPSAGFRWKPDGSQEPIPGGPADDKKRSSEMGKGTVNEVIASLRMLYEGLDEAGGITNPEKGALSNLSAGIASSETGQSAGRLFGTENQSKRNTIAQQRPLLLQAIMKATGMSAKQMDSNAELKLYLATATDPTLDVATNKRALDMIESLYGVGGTGEKPGAPGAGPKKISSDADYDSLPSGATFIAPDGTTRRKR
jgi:hypothetical protein